MKMKKSVVDKDMVSTGNQNQKKKLLSQTNEHLHDFVMNNETQIGAAEEETTRLGNNGRNRKDEKSTLGEKIACHYQVFQLNFAEWVESVNAKLTVPDNVVLMRLEIAVRSITGSSERRPNSVFENHDQRDLLRNIESFQLMTTCS